MALRRVTLSGNASLIATFSSYFVFCVFPVCYCFDASTRAIDCLETLVSEMSCYVLSRMLHSTHSVTHSQPTTSVVVLDYPIGLELPEF